MTKSFSFLGRAEEEEEDAFDVKGLMEAIV